MHESPTLAELEARIELATKRAEEHRQARDECLRDIREAWQGIHLLRVEADSALPTVLVERGRDSCGRWVVTRSTESSIWARPAGAADEVRFAVKQMGQANEVGGGFRRKHIRAGEVAKLRAWEAMGGRSCHGVSSSDAKV